jgi:hypothetical protein
VQILGPFPLGKFGQAYELLSQSTWKAVFFLPVLPSRRRVEIDIQSFLVELENSAFTPSCRLFEFPDAFKPLPVSQELQACQYPVQPNLGVWPVLGSVVVYTEVSGIIQKL